MKIKDAVEILMRGTEAHLKGAGCGPGHSVPTGLKKEEFTEAWERAHKYVYGFRKKWE